MFNFDPSKLVVRRLKLRAISKSTIDPRITFVDEHEREVKMPVPTAIARRVGLRLQGVSRFIVPYPCEIAFYEDRIVAVDAPNKTQYVELQKGTPWTSHMEKNSAAVHALDLSWMYDGQNVYKFTGKVLAVPGTSFGYQKAQAINLYQLGEPIYGTEEATLFQEMAALSFKNPQTGEWVTTTPVTNASGGMLQLTAPAINGSPVLSELQRMDRNVFPNLRFVNYAAKTISRNFSFEAIEPLGLPLLMIEHRTFNLGSMTTSVQASSPAPFKFTEGLAWLIGMFTQVRTLDQLLAIKSTMKMLMSKGNSSVKAAGTSKDKEIDAKVLIGDVRNHLNQLELIRF